MRFLHRVARARLLAGFAATAVAAPAAPAQSPDPEPTYYVCGAARTEAFGHIWYAIEVPVDGSARFHRINWHIPRRAEGLNLSAQWAGEAPVNDRLDDRATIWVSFYTTRRIRDEVRIEVRRTAGQRHASEFAYAGPFRRLNRPQGHPSYIQTAGRWGELKAWMSGRDALTFALVRRDGTVMAEGRLDATTLAGADAAIAAARPEVEARAADYRHRCREGPSTIYLVH